MAAKKIGLEWDCPNPKAPYNLGDLVELLKDDKTFAQFFTAKLKDALNGDKNAIECVDSYLAPTTQELQDLGIPASRVEGMRKCTDSGLLVLVIAADNA
jgi:hypothetical protein